jgi:two-component system nitrogen regulation response regulator GlnG
VIVMTAFGDLDTAVRAVRAGAFDYLVKPFDLEHVAAVVGRALAERAGLARAADAPPAPSVALVGRSTAMQDVYKKIALAAAADVPVLVTGAAGTGKGLVARAIHAASPRRDGAFVTTSLAALAPTALEGELFGRLDGGPGLAERADGGTLVIEQVDEASAAVQARLLQFLDHGEVFGGPAGRDRRVDVRVIATAESAPTRPIQRELADRLGAFTIAMPSLAQRRDDIEPLARAFAAASARGSTPVLSPDFLQALARRDWPGNVRELRSAVEHAAVVAHGGTLRPEHLPAPAERHGRDGLEDAAGGVGAAVKEWAAAARAAFGGLPEPDLHHRALKLVEATLLREALAHAGGNRTATAKLLGLDRATLRTKLRSLGLDD